MAKTIAKTARRAVGRGEVVSFTNPKTKKRVYGIAVGGGQTLKVWDPSLERFQAWKSDWSAEGTGERLPLTFGNLPADTAMEYLQAKYKGGRVLDQKLTYDKWLLAQLRVGKNILVQIPEGHGTSSFSAKIKTIKAGVITVHHEDVGEKKITPAHVTSLA